MLGYRYFKARPTDHVFIYTGGRLGPHQGLRARRLRLHTVRNCRCRAHGRARRRVRGRGGIFRLPECHDPGADLAPHRRSRRRGGATGLFHRSQDPQAQRRADEAGRRAFEGDRSECRPREPGPHHARYRAHPRRSGSVAPSSIRSGPIPASPRPAWRWSACWSSPSARRPRSARRSRRTCASSSCGRPMRRCSSVAVPPVRTSTSSAWATRRTRAKLHPVTDRERPCAGSRAQDARRGAGRDGGRRGRVRCARASGAGQALDRDRQGDHRGPGPEGMGEPGQQPLVTDLVVGRPRSHRRRSRPLRHAPSPRHPGPRPSAQGPSWSYATALSPRRAS